MPLTDEDCEALETELGAAKCLVPTSPEERAYNAALSKAIRFLNSYKRGDGLFQKVKVIDA